MHNPALLLASLAASLYCITCLYQGYRHGHLAAPHSLYAALALLHFFIPGMLVGLGLAPDFVHYRNGYFALTAILFAATGLVAFQLGSISAWRGLFLKRLRFNPAASIRRNWQVPRLLIVSTLLFAAGWLSRFYIILHQAYFQIDRGGQNNIEGPFHAAIRMVELFPLHLICLLSIKFWAGAPRSFPALGRLLIFSVATELLYWIPSGRKEGVILAVILPLLVRYLMTRKMPSIRAILIFGFSLVVLFPLTFVYRRQLEISGHFPELSEIAKTAYLAFTGSGTEKSALEILYGRLSLLESLCACVRIWEQQIWEPMLGNSYLSALLGLIPRFFWPEKPDLHYGNEFGYVANFISSGDFRTSISVTFFGEAYLNFGFAGLVPLFFMGVLFGLMYRLIYTSRRYETGLLLYLITIPTLLYVGGTFGLYFGGLIKLLPFYYLVGRNLEKRPNQKMGPLIAIRKTG